MNRVRYKSNRYSNSPQLKNIKYKLFSKSTSVSFGNSSLGFGGSKPPGQNGQLEGAPRTSSVTLAGGRVNELEFRAVHPKLSTATSRKSTNSPVVGFLLTCNH